MQFIDDNTYNIDVVPSSWLHFDKSADDLVTKFMPPPYSKSKSDHLHSIVKACESPPQQWPTFRVSIKGSARKLPFFISISYMYITTSITRLFSL